MDWERENMVGIIESFQIYARLNNVPAIDFGCVSLWFYNSWAVVKRVLLMWLCYMLANDEGKEVSLEETDERLGTKVFEKSAPICF